MSASDTPAAAERSVVPDKANLVLLALILVAAVANLNLAVENVALPSIGKAFDASQTELNLIEVGYSLGLAAVLLCGILVWFFFPLVDREKALLASYAEEDASATA